MVVGSSMRVVPVEGVRSGGKEGALMGTPLSPFMQGADMIISISQRRKLRLLEARI